MDSSKEEIKTFGLIVQKALGSSDDDILVQHYNKGVPFSEVILAIEAWVNKAKDDWQRDALDNTFFG